MLSQLLSPRKGLLVHFSLFILMGFMPALAYSQPTFTLSFSPSTIGPGSISTLQYTLVSFEGVPVTDLAFSNTLPAGMTIATPGQALSSCQGTLTAPDGGGTVTLTGGQLGASGSCTITVNVTTSTPGVHTNTTGDLTSSAGNSGPATADLTVDTARPGFSKSFSPGSTSLGARSTLSFTIDNSANTNPAFSLTFTDNLTGMLIADPANVSTTCIGGVLTAVPETSTLSLSSASVTAGATCTVSVDVTANATGSLGNTSGDLTSFDGFVTLNSGKTGAVLNVTADTIHLDKSFTNDPATPGTTVDLEFTISNFDRILPATNISFSDDLDAILFGLTAVGLPKNDVCGAGSLLEITSQTEVSLLTLTSGNLAPDDSCTFNVTLNIPAGAATGTYLNTTSSLSADRDGKTETFAAASASLFINEAPLLTKTFVTDPVGAGDTTTIEFTITNTSAISTATDIAFIDELTTFLPFPVSVTLPAPGFCGPSSMLFLTSPDTDQHVLDMTGGELTPGASCTFSADITIPEGMPSGTYLNTTGNITATVNETTQTGRSASDTLTVLGAPSLTKSFTNDPVLPDDTVTLEFTLSHDALAAGDATGITFTDDLAATLPGLTALGLPQNNICGIGSNISGTSDLTFTAGTLTPGETCTFSVTLQVPTDNAFGSHTNTTSALSATVNGVAVTGNSAKDDLLVSPMVFSKDFTDDPAIPGDTVTLEFTLTNSSPTANVTAMSFTDDLNAALSGLAVTGPLPSEPCGPGSAITGSTSLDFTGGNLVPLASCTFPLTLQVPPSASSNSYKNVTTALVASIDNNPVVLNPATADLVVDANLLQLTKSFTNDPAPPGGTVTLEFTLNNQHATQSATSIAFTDDLDATLPGLVATGLPVSACGGTLSGTSILDFSGGMLNPSGSCTFSVELQIPSGLPSGTLATNTTSQVTGTITGLAVTGDPASDNLEIGFITFNKSFSEITTAGETVTLHFTLQNNNSLSTPNDLRFSDDLNNMFPGLVATGLPVNDICGSGSVMFGTDVISVSGANLLAGASCSFSVNLSVPMSAAQGLFTNTTSFLTVDGQNVANPATAILEVDNDKDNDGVMIQDDNCPTISNADQADYDGDNLGDACDPDDDNDTVPDTSDNCPFTANPGQANYDGDGNGDSCDLDDDNDGMPDTWEIKNSLNPYDAFDANRDDDNDGFTNQQEYGFHSDPNVFDSDKNHNGVPDRTDGIRGTIAPIWYLLYHQSTI
jgi:Thrombospondin type 3 repeat